MQVALTLDFLLKLSNVDDWCIVVKGFVGVTVPFVKFVLEFDPVQSQCMQEALKEIHCHENSSGDWCPGQITQPDANNWVFLQLSI